MKDVTKPSCALAVALFAFGSFTGAADAAITVTISDDGTNLTMTATGSYDLSAATGGSTGGMGTPLGTNALFDSVRFGWETTAATSAFLVRQLGVLTSGSDVFPASSVTTTNPFNFDSSTSILQIVDSAPLIGTVNETAIFNGVTISSLGMVYGEQMTLVWPGDSLVVQVVPEPSSALLLSLGVLGMGTFRRRSKA